MFSYFPSSKLALLSIGIFCVSGCFTPVLADNFESCRVSFKKQATEQGYSNYIVNDVIDNLKSNKKVISYDNNQAEFAESFSQYTQIRVTDFRISKGREKLKEHRVLLEKLSEKYGVPPQYLVAFWGLETNFGKHKGKMSVLNSLATLACDKRRSAYFTHELFTLFDLIDNNTVTVKQLKGSWAGAMGHMQFMPSAFKQYTIDGDADGKIDVWESEVDALSSAANYLQKIGWQKQSVWGAQVKLPDNFLFERIHFDKSYPLADFNAVGITDLQGNKLAYSDETQAELVLPEGHLGSAFLVFDNFHVIMKWNLSKSYALSVANLAAKINNKPGIVFKTTNAVPRYLKSQLKQLQQVLKSKGYSTGKPDGLWGPNTRKAIRAFQLDHKLIADGYPNNSVFNTAGVAI